MVVVMVVVPLFGFSQTETLLPYLLIKQKYLLQISRYLQHLNHRKHPSLHFDARLKIQLCYKKWFLLRILRATKALTKSIYRHSIKITRIPLKLKCCMIISLSRSLLSNIGSVEEHRYKTLNCLDVLPRNIWMWLWK